MMCRIRRSTQSLGTDDQKGGRDGLTNEDRGAEPDASPAKDTWLR